MFRNYILVAFRNLFRQRWYALLNVSGLAIGMACSILILLYVKSEVSFDRHHEDYQNIVRIENVSVTPDGARKPNFCSIAPSFVPLIEAEFPEFKHIARMFRPGQTMVHVGTRRFDEERLYFSEDDIFRILTIPLISGDPGTCLNGPGQIVLSRSVADKYFGSEDPMGKELTLDGEMSCMVSGVMADPVDHTHLPIDILVSYESLRGLYGEGENDYFFGQNNFSDNVCITYARLASGTDLSILEHRIMEMVDRLAATRPSADGRVTIPSKFMLLGLRPVADIHLNSHSRNELEPGGDSRMVWMFGLIAMIILCIACINFINISTARATRRAREVGLRKVSGAARISLILQFLGESLVVTIFAALLAIAMVELLLPVFGNLSGVMFEHGILAEPDQLLIIVVVVLVTGLASGLYPAFYLSMFRPSEILRGEVTGGRRGALGRKILVVFQFTVTIVLIVGVILAYRQIRFLRDANLGFDREHVLLTGIGTGMADRWETVKQRILEHPDVLAVAGSKRAPGDRLLDDPGYEILLDGQWQKSIFSMPHNRVDEDFFRTYDIRMAAGRDFSSDFQTDREEAVILNETAARYLGKTPAELVGTSIRWGNRSGTVIGVSTDFHYESLHSPITPVMTYQETPGAFTTISIRVSGRNMAAVMAHLDRVWSELQPGTDLEVQYLDDRVRRLYRNEERTMGILGAFSVLAVMIACLGLMGLVSYSVERRGKEISLRKVLGSSAGKIVALLSGNYMKLMLIANLVGWPIAYFLLTKWLSQFAYRVSMDWWVFVLSGLIAAAIAQLTVSLQSLRGALANPVDALRNE